mmetsp:Transcript_45653/g.111186  ORF Transcript_45653/g.111186 Transcript_45653/m.111186 type:complete len:104 (-) Transcript_45653:1-312(-)
MVLALLLPLEPQCCLFQRCKSLASIDGINKYLSFNFDPNVTAKTTINCPGVNSVSVGLRKTYLPSLYPPPFAVKRFYFWLFGRDVVIFERLFFLSVLRKMTCC